VSIACATGPPKKEARAENRRATGKRKRAQTLPPTEPKDKRAADPLEVFRARCEARAHLYATGDLDLHDAVDVLQEGAVKLGLVERIGQDAVQAIMAAAFNPVRDDLVSNEDKVADTEPPPAFRVARSTLDAAIWLTKYCNDNPEQRFRAWLAEHSARERAAICQHIENNKRARPCP
jgi:hypothetical protein